MEKLTDIRLCEAQFSTQYLKYRAPMKFGGRVVDSAVLVNVEIEVETRDGRRGRGNGSMPMSNTWAWPSRQVDGEKALRIMIDLAREVTREAGTYQGIGHPLEITHDLAETYSRRADEARRAAGVSEAVPRLAQLVAASPIEAAVHDAYGKVLGQNSYCLLGPEFVHTDLREYLGDDFQGEYLDRYVLPNPKPRMPLYHLVGALDPLTSADLTSRINDGLPETLPEWIAYNGLTHLKIKLNGDDLAWDVERAISIERVAAEAQAARSCKEWFYSADFNEKCANVEYVLDFLEQVRERSPAAFSRLQYVEQPTHRDLRMTPENRMHRAAAIKPVVIDESLVDLNSLLMSRELGYSGVALKACKGHSGALLMGAAAQKYGMFLCVQDLTCPGASLLHSASLAARVPGVAAIEANARQYCPEGNAGWDQRFPEMFHVTDGTMGTAVLAGPGLGF